MIENQIEELFEWLEREVSKYNPYYNRDLLKKAFLFAYDAHKWVLRKSKDPYITHPLNVALHLAKIEADEVSIIAALLHDVCDNASVSADLIKKEFWEEVFEIISWVNKLWDLYYTLDMNQKDIEHLKNMLVQAGSDIRIFLVKIADRYHNLETLEFLPKQKRYRIARETQEIYLPIVNFLSIWEFLWYMHNLCFKYTEEEEYKKLNKIFGKNKKKHESQIITAHNKIKKVFDDEKIWIINIEWRVKSLYSIYNKIKNKHIDYTEVYDVLALRVITKNLWDAYRALGVIHKLYKIKNDRFKDYISSPKDNGYQSIHTTVYDENWDFLEFQIQTTQMFQLNKSWLAAHFIYKWFGVEYNNLPNWMKGVLDIQKQTIDSKSFLEKLSQEIIISNIKCFDEKGGTHLLPKKSTLIDYAFSQSLNEGKYFFEALINGNIVKNPFYILQNGDSITLKKWQKIYFDYKIENFFLLQTDIAKEQIKGILKKYSQSKSIQLGKYILDNQLETLWYRHFYAMNTTTKKHIFKSIWVWDEQMLYLWLGIGSIEVEKVINKISPFYTQGEKVYKNIVLKIKFKTKDFLSINHILQTFFTLGIDITKVIYKESKNLAWFEFSLARDFSQFSDALKELKRVPNVASISRVFPIRLKIYYTLCSLIVVCILIVPFIIQRLNISHSEKSFLLELVLFGSSVCMVGMVFSLKYIVQVTLPDVLRYKRFWLSLFWLNTLIFFVLFWELSTFWVKINFILYFLFFSIVYIIMFYEFLKNKTPR